MGRLHGFRDYVLDRWETVRKAERRLDGLQQKYETYFAEVGKVRESELAQLRHAIFARRGRLPGGLDRELDEALEAAGRDFDRRLEELAGEHARLLAEAEKLRAASLEAEHAVRERNVALDRAEEELKERNRKLLSRITDYNRRIRELGRGFGFFSNLFRMRRLRAERRLLDEQQADLAARIEALRARWVREEKAHADEEARLRQAWLDRSTEAAARGAKIEHLRAARGRIVERTALERVLFDRRPDLPAPGPDDPRCPRCGVPNPAGNHFCFICARRLAEDRPDLAGSLRELAELNLHHQRFSEGMRACQEIIGLVRGLAAGLSAFSRSVDDMIASEDRYPLPKLQIDVPEGSLAYGRNFDKLLDAVQDDQSLHPKAFAERVNRWIGGVYTEQNIKDFFETMGEELSRQADRQW